MKLFLELLLEMQIVLLLFFLYSIKCKYIFAGVV